MERKDAPLHQAVQVGSADLGANCWSPARFLGRCHTCSRYERCAYPERVPDQEYDTTLKKARAAKARADTLFKRARELSGRTIE